VLCCGRGDALRGGGFVTGTLGRAGGSWGPAEGA
jgi:hypothetical protein